MEDSREISRQTLATGRFISLGTIRWKTAAGREAVWEVAERTGNAQAVMLIATLTPSRRLVLVRQYRPPAKGHVIEFPAGLISPGEAPEETALRELYEETGYRGRVLRVLPPAFNTPGLSSESAHPVFLEVDETSPGNAHPVPQPMDDEEIEVVLVQHGRFDEFIRQELSRGALFDTKVIAYLSAYNSAQSDPDGGHAATT